MKRGRLEAHLKAKHSAHINSVLSYFKTLKENFEKRTTIKSLFTAHTSTNNRVLETSYQISLFIAKTGKNHTIGENLIKPSISAFLKTVLEKDVKAMPLSINTVSRRIDEMGEDIEKQLVEKLKTRKCSVQMDESTLRDSEAALITYVRYIDKEHFAEEILFFKRLESTTTFKDIFNKLKNYLDVNDIPMKNITSCAADGAPNMMGKKNDCLKLMKDANPEMILVHCVIHRQNLVAQNISPVLNEILHTVIKCVNVIKASAKCEQLFKLFCEQNEDHVRLLLHTLNILNKQLQGTNKILVDAKAKAFGFITNIELCQKHINNKDFEQFHWLQKCEVTDTALLVIVNHLNNLSANFKERFLDLQQIDFPTWMMQPMLVDLSDISNMQYQAELAELQNDSVKTLFSIKGAMAWLSEEMEIKYPNSTKCARKLLLPFPSSFLAECGFNAVNDLLIKKKK
ncbi:protein ZBED8 [Trichonephila clavipes]|nr:protein ZBED8 [Trichonephila clavipes]